MKQVIVTLNFIMLSIFLLACGGITAKQDGSVKLKKLNDYKVSDFKLTNDVSYFEIESYNTSELNKKLQFLPRVGGKRTKIFFDQSAYQALTDKDKSKVNIAFPKFAKSDHLGARIAPPMTRNMGHIMSISNLRYLDKQSKVHTIPTTSGVMDLLGDIDTAAEIQLVLWMNNERPAKSYKKVNNQYEITINYFVPTSFVQNCGTYTYRIIMDLNGKILEKKLLKFKKPKETCLVV